MLTCHRSTDGWTSSVNKPELLKPKPEFKMKDKRTIQRTRQSLG